MLSVIRFAGLDQRAIRTLKSIIWDTIKESHMSLALGFPGNLNFSGTVSAPLFVSNQQIIAPVAAGTASTLTVSSISSNFASISTMYAATLTSPKLTAGTVSGTLATFGTITGTTLNLPGANFVNFGSDQTKATSAGFIGYQVATPNALDVYGAGVSVGSRTVMVWDNLTVAGTTKATGSLTTNQGLQVSNTTGQAQLLLSAGTSTTYYASRIDFYGAASTTLPRWLMINDYSQNNTNDFRLCASNQASVVPITCLQSGNVGINQTSPAYTLDCSGSARVTGSLILSNGNGVMNGRNIQSGTVAASAGNLVTVTFPYAFNSVPVVTMTCLYAGPQREYLLVPYVSSVSTTTFQMYAVYLDTADASPNSITRYSGNSYNWIAVSPTG